MKHHNQLQKSEFQLPSFSWQVKVVLKSSFTKIYIVWAVDKTTENTPVLPEVTEKYKSQQPFNIGPSSLFQKTAKQNTDYSGKEKCFRLQGR